jgi:hypothetical protein
MKVELWPIDRPRPYGKNPRKITQKAIEKVAASIREFGFRQPLVCDPKDTIIVGHKRLLGAQKLGLSKVPVTIAHDLSPAQIKAYRLADNRTADETDWDDDLLADELADLDAMGWDLGLTGFDPIEISALRDPGSDPAATLAERFLVAPFSVLNAREGWWQERKAAWLALGIESELGRGGNLLRMSDTILDPDGSKGIRANLTGGPGAKTLGAIPRNSAAALSHARRDQTTRRAAPKPPAIPEPQWLTPCLSDASGIWLKRDDLFEHAGAIGGKARACAAIAEADPKPAGLITAGSRASPQINIVAQIAKFLSIPCRAHCPQGPLSPELEAARAAGAEIIQHPAGYNNVIVARAREDAQAHPNWREIPFGMECPEAIAMTAAQCENLPREAKRLIIPIGSGMSAAGILWGLKHFDIQIPILGIQCGADPIKRLNRWAPQDWRDRMTIIKPPEDYHAEVDAAINGVALDRHYEAKAARYVEPGDILWIVGIRSTQGEATSAFQARGLAAGSPRRPDHPPRPAGP